jgi:hypothetical protein
MRRTRRSLVTAAILVSLGLLGSGCAGRETAETAPRMPPKLADEMRTCENQIRRSSDPMGFGCVLFNVGVDGQSGPTWIEPKWWTALPKIPAPRRIAVLRVTDQRPEANPYRFGRASIVGRGGVWLSEEEPVAVTLARTLGLALYGRGAAVIESWRTDNPPPR